MFGFVARSKPTASLLSVAIVASAMLAPTAFAAPYSAGNTFEIPVVSHDSMAGPANAAPQHRTMRAPAHVKKHARAKRTRTHVNEHARAMLTNPEPGVDANSSSNSAANCVNGRRWEETAANGWTLPMPCHS